MKQVSEKICSLPLNNKLTDTVGTKYFIITAYKEGTIVIRKWAFLVNFLMSLFFSANIPRDTRAKDRVTRNI